MTNLISVIIPVYNTEKYLNRCIDSIINNDYKNLEIICINDGSTDDSLSILQEYQSKDIRVKVIDVPNGGSSRARNLGLDIASGDYICFIDSDDWVHKQFFILMMKTMLDNSADVVSCMYLRTSCYREDVYVIPSKAIIHSIPFSQAYKNHITKANVHSHIYSRRCLSDNRFDESLEVSEDALFNMDLFACNSDLSVVIINTPLYYYYNRTGSCINSSPVNNFMPVIYKYLDRCELYSDTNVIQAYLREAIKRTLACRYLSTYSNNEHLNREIKDLLQRCMCIKKLQKPFKQKESIIYFVLIKFPFLYRLIRLINDPTMRQWEHEQRMANKVQ